MNAIKNAAAKKPKKKIARPEVMTGFRSKILRKTDPTQSVLNIAHWKINLKNILLVLISLTIFPQYRTAIKLWCLTWWKIASLRSLLSW